MSNLGEALKQLVTPVHYVRIKHPVKPYFDWVIPGVFAVGAILFFLFSPKDVLVIGDGGLVDSVSDLIKCISSDQI